MPIPSERTSYEKNLIHCPEMATIRKFSTQNCRICSTGNKSNYCKDKDPGDGLGIFADRDLRSIFWVSNFENLQLYFFWVLVIVAVFFGLSNKCCVFECFICSKEFLGPSLFSWYFNKHSFSSLSYCAQLLLNESYLEWVFFRVSLFWKVFLGVFYQWQRIFWVIRKYPTADPCLKICQVQLLGM